MAVSRAERRAERRDRVVASFGEEQADAALDLLELLEFAWHDCYAEITPFERLIDDVLVCSHGELAGLIGAARLAITGRRDLDLWAQSERAERPR